MSEIVIKFKNIIFYYFFNLLSNFNKNRKVFYSLEKVKKTNIKKTNEKINLAITKIYENNNEHPLAYYEHANSYVNTDPLFTFNKLENFTEIQKNWEKKQKNNGVRYLPLQQVIGSIGNYLTVYYYLLHYYNINQELNKPTLLIKANEKLNNNFIFKLFAPHLNVIKNSYKFFRDRDLIETFQIPLKICMPFKSKCYPWFIGINYINQEIEKKENPIFKKLSLNEDQISEGQIISEKLGLKNGDWYVTLHVREGKGNNYTNSNPKTYLPAVEEVISRGGKVVRVGDRRMTKLPKINGLIDYPFTDHKSEMMDIFLAKNSKFCIGTSSGYWTFAAFLGVPVLLTNYLPTLDYFLLKKQDMFLPKKLINKSKEEKLTFDQIFKYPDAYVDTDEGLRKYEIIDNSKDEILDAVKDMIRKVNNKASTGFSEHNQKFKNQISNLNNFKDGNLKCFADLSENFLKNNN